MSELPLRPELVEYEAFIRAARIERAQVVGRILMAGVTGPVRWLTAYGRQVLRAHRGRLGIRPLLAMSNAELKDLGLNRCDVLDAMHLPMAEEPGEFLEARRGHSERGWANLVAKVRRTPVKPAAQSPDLRAA